MNDGGRALCSGSKSVGSWFASSDNSWFRPAAAVYLSTNRLQLGDVLLFAPAHPSPIQKAIQLQQKRWGSTEQHSRFTHAVLYIGLDHLICESVPVHGVRYASLESRLSDACLVARRFPGLSDGERGLIAAEARRRLDLPYGYWSAFLAPLKRKFAEHWDENVGEGLVCSRLCDRALVEALIESRPNDALRLHESSWITPANLSESTRLVDVRLEWQSVT